LINIDTEDTQTYEYKFYRPAIIIVARKTLRMLKFVVRGYHRPAEQPTGTEISTDTVGGSVLGAHVGGYVLGAHVGKSVQGAHVGGSVQGAHVGGSVQGAQVRGSVQGAHVGGSVRGTHAADMVIEDKDEEPSSSEMQALVGIIQNRSRDIEKRERHVQFVDEKVSRMDTETRMDTDKTGLSKRQKDH